MARVSSRRAKGGTPQAHPSAPHRRGLGRVPRTPPAGGGARQDTPPAGRIDDRGWGTPTPGWGTPTPGWGPLPLVGAPLPLVGAPYGTVQTRVGASHFCRSWYPAGRAGWPAVSSRRAKGGTPQAHPSAPHRRGVWSGCPAHRPPGNAGARMRCPPGALTTAVGAPLPLRDGATSRRGVPFLSIVVPGRPRRIPPAPPRRAKGGTPQAHPSALHRRANGVPRRAGEKRGTRMNAGGRG